MSTTAPVILSKLYHQDETAWLQAMSELAAAGHHTEMDFRHLSEYLADMAKRDFREVYSRLVVLWTHILKWDRQPRKRSGSWRGTIMEQRRELNLLLESETLRNYAESILAEVFLHARQQAAAETGLARADFPEADPRTLDDLLTDAEQSP
jgi:hypothetical protein